MSIRNCVRYAVQNATAGIDPLLTGGSCATSRHSVELRQAFRHHSLFPAVPHETQNWQFGWSSSLPQSVASLCVSLRTSRVDFGIFVGSFIVLDLARTSRIVPTAPALLFQLSARSQLQISPNGSYRLRMLAQNSIPARKKRFSRRRVPTGKKR